MAKSKSHKSQPAPNAGTRVRDAQTAALDSAAAERKDAAYMLDGSGLEPYARAAGTYAFRYVVTLLAELDSDVALTAAYHACAVALWNATAALHTLAENATDVRETDARETALDAALRVVAPDGGKLDKRADKAATAAFVQATRDSASSLGWRDDS